MSVKGFIVNGKNEKYDYNALDNKPSGSGDGLTEEVKQALLNCFQKVAYIDDDGRVYHQALYDALYGTQKVLTSIAASYTQSGEVLTTDSLDSLRKDIVVTAYYDDSTFDTVSDYSLSGNLTAGTSTVTVYYNGMTDTISVAVTAVAGTYTISNHLAGCTTSNSATTIAEGGSYTAMITANSGYTLIGATASVTMGGNTVTGAYSNGTISITNVTGDIVITVTAVARTVSSISAVFSQGSNVVYTTDSLNSLKPYLVVTANYSDGGSETVSDYTLSGTLTAGTSTITVSYGGMTTTFDVTVTEYVVEIPTEGLLGYWDFRNLEAIPTAPVAADQGTARIVRFAASASDQYGLTKSASAWAFNFSGGTTYDKFPVPFTIAGLSHDPQFAMSLWGNNCLVTEAPLPRFNILPYYKTTGGETKYVIEGVPKKPDATYTSLIITVDNNSIDYYVDGVLTKTLNTADLEDFASWSYTTTTYANAGGGTNVTALGMWNRKLTETEVMDVQEVFLSLEVSE